VPQDGAAVVSEQKGFIYQDRRGFSTTPKTALQTSFTDEIVCLVSVHAQNSF
jgi:hypothetical protein